MHANDPDNFCDPVGDADLSHAEAAAAIYALADALGLDAIADAAHETVDAELREALREHDEGTDAFDFLLDEAQRAVKCRAEYAPGVLKYELAREVERQKRVRLLNAARRSAAQVAA